MCVCRNKYVCNVPFTFPFIYDSAKLLNANQLINPKCTVCRQPNPVQKTEEHLFIDLEKLQVESMGCV